jgi:hypothetical protein
MHKAKIFRKKLLENKEMDFRIGLMNIQAAGYNGECKVIFQMMK